MPLDAMVLSALREELAPPLLGARIDRISMPEKDMLVLSVHSRTEGNRKLLISLRPGSARIQFTERAMENPPQPPMFCMLLRKHLLGAGVTGLEQPPGERLLLLQLDTTDELNYHSRRTLAVELMGKGLNLALIDAEGRIVDCLRRVEYGEGQRRPMLPGLFYQLPPAQDKPILSDLPEEELAALLAGADRNDAPDRWLLRTFAGLSPFVCRELAADGWEGLPERIAALRGCTERGEYLPVMVSLRGEPKDFSFQHVRQFGPEGEETFFDSFSALLDAFYGARDAWESVRRRSSELTRTVKTALSRLQRKTAAREQELFATRDRETWRRRGDLITANMYRLRRGMESFEAEDFYADGCPTVTVPLDKLKTPQQNAARYYKLYAKAKTAERILTELISSSREEETYLESVLDELERAEGERDLTEIRAELTDAGYIKERGGKKKRPGLRKPMRFLSDSGREILVGRGNLQNDELTFRLARRTDLWLHVQKVPGSHVIVSCAEGEPDEQTLRQAAALAVTFSRAREGGKAAVDCTEVRRVKKPSGARPGRVIYTEYRTLIASADEALAKRLRKDR